MAKQNNRTVVAERSKGPRIDDACLAMLFIPTLACNAIYIKMSHYSTNAQDAHAWSPL
jgi:hypothetical protein